MKKAYIANCIDCLDNRRFTSIYAEDATQLAQIVENGKELTEQEFLQQCNVPISILNLIAEDSRNFGLNQDCDLAWVYDDSNDVHYFFG